MAKIKPMALIESMSGKVCQDSDVYFTRRHGKTFTGKMCNPHRGDPTVSQKSVQDKFRQTAARVKTVLKSGPGNDSYDELVEGFKNQDKYPTLWGYAFAQIWKD
ncbi:MAG: hypothetical protein MJZ15_04435 [Bacteroidales bacterium]|nr:hypothetical protein [Bacteroidales bacterium]